MSEPSPTTAKERVRDLERLLARHFAIGSADDFNALTVDISAVLDGREKLDTFDRGFYLQRKRAEAAITRVRSLEHVVGELVEALSETLQFAAGFDKGKAESVLARARKVQGKEAPDAT